jgi:ElaB/YqjD/DUF883 family membrane-anchored ribosome-binding protein
LNRMEVAGYARCMTPETADRRATEIELATRAMRDGERKEAPPRRGAGLRRNRPSANETYGSRAEKEIAMTETTEQLALGRQKIVEDLRVLLTDSEEMLRLAATVPGEGLDSLRERLRTHVDTLQAALGDAQTSAHRRYRSATVQTERYVRQNPWQSLGIAAGVGFALGLLASR